MKQILLQAALTWRTIFCKFIFFNRKRIRERLKLKKLVSPHHRLRSVRNRCAVPLAIYCVLVSKKS